MSSQETILLKFGGSVLVNEDSFAHAVHEVARWRREGLRVIAVCSATHGETARRIASCPDEFGPHQRADYLAEGERAAAKKLGGALELAGLEARVKSPEAIRLRAVGSPTESTLVSVDVNGLQRHLERVPIAVVPGFYAHDENGRTVLLGVGGSDSTALFLADALGGIRCRLLKDVPALFEEDPKEPGPPPRRYVRANYAAVLATDGCIVQHRAVVFARERSLSFEIAALQGVECTEVGHQASTFQAEPSPQRPLRVALLGAGTVGGGVAQRLLRDPERFELTGVLVRSTEAQRSDSIPVDRLTDRPERIWDRSPEMVIELLGGLEPAGQLVEEALARGADVITANKRLLAERGDHLRGIARRNGARLLASASVGGAVPVLEHLSRVDPRRVVRLRGALNGTANFVLESLSTGQTLESAVAQARDLGLAEADVDRDLAGLDALDKLHVLAQALGWNVPLGAVPACTLPRPGSARQHQVAYLDRDKASVVHTVLDADDPLSDVSGASNRIVVDLEGGPRLSLSGVGAGRWPTTESVIGDVLEIWRERGSREKEVSRAV